MLLFFLIPIFINAEEFADRCPGVARPQPTDENNNCMIGNSKVARQDGTFYCCDTVLSCGNRIDRIGADFNTTNEAYKIESLFKDGCKGPLHQETSGLRERYSIPLKNADGKYIICADDSECEHFDSRLYCDSVNVRSQVNLVKMCFEKNPAIYRDATFPRPRKCLDDTDCSGGYCRSFTDLQKAQVLGKNRTDVKFCASFMNCGGNRKHIPVDSECKNNDDCARGENCVFYVDGRRMCCKPGYGMTVDPNPPTEIGLPVVIAPPPTPAPTTTPVPTTVATTTTPYVVTTTYEPPPSAPPPPNRVEEQVAIIAEILDRMERVEPKRVKFNYHHYLYSTPFTIVFCTFVLATTVLSIMVMYLKKIDKEDVQLMDRVVEEEKDEDDEEDDSDREIIFVD